MKSLTLFAPVGFVLAGCVVLLLLIVLPWMIASTRKAQHAIRVRHISLAGVVLSTFGFIWSLLAQRRPNVWVVILGIAPGAIIWLISLIWGCLGRPALVVRGFEVRPVSAPPESSQ